MENQSIYHERQSKQLCLLHSLNNLFQCKEFRKEELDEMCKNLSPDVWINPHKSLIGFGNYDINVMMVALETKNYEALWFDKRKKVTELNLDKIFGLILNLKISKNLLSYLNPLNYLGERKHWIAIRKINSVWYNLDSKFIKPKRIGDNGFDDDFLHFLEKKNEDTDCQIFIIVNKLVKDEVYLNDHSKSVDFN